MYPHSLQQRPRQSLGHRLATHVQNFDGCFRAAADPFRQLQQAVAAALGVVATFQSRSGRTQYHRNPELPATNDRQIAGVIAEAILLFEGWIVLLVDDEDARRAQWREYRRAGADHHPGDAGASQQPGIQSFPIAQAGVQHGQRSR